MAESGPDKRLSWLGARVCTTLKVKEDVWKTISTGESKYVKYLLAVFMSAVVRLPCSVRAACTCLNGVIYGILF